MDWDLDGKLDILSGCYLTPGIQAGHLQFLRGKEGIDFEAAKTIKNDKGQPVLNVAATESSDMQLKLKNFCTHQHAVDYDNDGDLDLVVGSNIDQFYFHENVADAGLAPAISSSSIALPVRLPGPARHSAPHLADWDNDGDLDLISGSSAGGVFISENSGTRDAPSYEPFQVLIPLPESDSPTVEKRIDSDDFELGKSTRVWTTDFDGDGWLDLLIGDCSAVMEKETGFVWVYVRKPPQQF